MVKLSEVQKCKIPLEIFYGLDFRWSWLNFSISESRVKLSYFGF